MKSYADTNFFTNYYLELAEGERARELLNHLAPHNHLLSITWLLHLEYANALERMVFETRQGGQRYRATPEGAAAAHAQFEENLRDEIHIHEVVLPLLRVMDDCRALILRHTAKHGFRTYDIVHVASALALGCDTFWSFDQRVLRLARLEGLRTN